MRPQIFCIAAEDEIALKNQFDSTCLRLTVCPFAIEVATIMLHTTYFFALPLNRV